MHPLLRPAPRRLRARVCAGVPHRLDPVRAARRAEVTRFRPSRDAPRPRRCRRSSLRSRRARRRRRFRRVLPPPRRARDLRPATRSGRHDARPAAPLAVGGGRGDRIRRRRGGLAARGATLMPRGGKAEKAMVPEAEFRSYYDRPVLKEPVWKWYVPAYFFAGGLAAGSSMLAAGADLLGRPDIARRARLASV